MLLLSDMWLPWLRIELFTKWERVEGQHNLRSVPDAQKKF